MKFCCVFDLLLPLFTPTFSFSLLSKLMSVVPEPLSVAGSIQSLLVVPVIFDMPATVILCASDLGNVWAPTVKMEESIGSPSLSLNRVLLCAKELAIIPFSSRVGFLGAFIRDSLPDPSPDWNSNLPGCGMCCEMGVGTVAAVTLGGAAGLPLASPSSFESCLSLSAMASLSLIGGYTASLSVSDEMSECSDSTSTTDSAKLL